MKRVFCALCALLLLTSSLFSCGGRLTGAGAIAEVTLTFHAPGDAWEKADSDAAEAVDIIDFNFGSRPGLNDYWHTEKDTMDKVSEESLHAAGRLAAEIVNALVSARAQRPPSGERP